MANFACATKWSLNDDYYTPHEGWDMIYPLVMTKRWSHIVEPCMLGAVLSTSPKYWGRKGFRVSYDTKWDFLKDTPSDKFYEDVDVLITNIPFNKELKIPILKKLVKTGKPFITIMSGMNIHTKYFKEIFGDIQEDLEIIHPSRKINFQKLVHDECGNAFLEQTKSCSFYSVFVCYKCNFGITLV